MTLGQGQGELGTGTQTIGSEKMKTLSIGETLIDPNFASFTAARRVAGA
jgi:hypothetical protein